MARAQQTYPEGHRLAGDDYIVETGRGIVEVFAEPKVGDRNVRIEIKATHTQLANPIGGFVDATNDEHMALVRASFADGKEVGYKLEVHRKRNAPPPTEIPFEDLTKDQKVREFVWIGDRNGQPPAAKAGGAQKAAAPRSGGQTNGHAQQARSEAPAAQERPQQAQQSQPPQQEQAPPPPDPGLTPDRPASQRKAKMVEGKPWEPLNTDGSPNLGSYAVTAGVGMVDLAVELLIAAERSPKRDLVRFVATKLIDAADEIQAGVRPDGRPDRMDNSHTRARGVLRTALSFMPFPVELVDDEGKVTPEHVDAVHAWYGRLVPTGIALLQIGLDLSGIDWRQADPPAPTNAQRTAERDYALHVTQLWIDTVGDDAEGRKEMAEAQNDYASFMRNPDISGAVKARLKDFKVASNIGWPLTPAEYETIMAKAQELIREEAACPSCKAAPCECAADEPPEQPQAEAPVNAPVRQSHVSTCPRCGRRVDDPPSVPFCPACEPF